jgi:hypothetical protein
MVSPVPAQAVRAWARASFAHHMSLQVKAKQLGLDDLPTEPFSRVTESLIAAYERGRQSVLSPKAPVITGKDYLQQVIRDVAVLRGVSIVDILSTSRIKHIAHARQEVAWRMRQAKDEHGKPRFSFPQIAHWMGGLDHSTIVHAVKAHEGRMQEADQ